MYTSNKYTNKIKPGAGSVNKEAQEGRDAKISWEGDSLQVLRGFPERPRGNLGHYLRFVQQGVQPPDANPVAGLEGVFELRDQDERAWYRVLYLKKIKGTIYVLHCFEKRSNRIENKDIHTAEARMKRVRARLAEEARHAKSEGRKTTRDGGKRS
jgi:phage-related protein